MEHDTTQITFQAPIKPVRERVHTKLLKSSACIRGKYFRTNFSHQLQYASIDSKENLSDLFAFAFLPVQLLMKHVFYFKHR